MQKSELSIPGVWELRPKIFRDSRGFFMETYNQKEVAQLGITDSFAQDNIPRPPKAQSAGSITSSGTHKQNFAV